MTGEVAGTVVDYSGAVVAGAAVSLKSEAHGELENGQTDGLGQFRFALLKPGTYTLTVTAPDLETSGQHVTVNLGRITTVTIRLTIGTVTTTVEVTEQPKMLDARSGNLATTYQTNQLASLPAPGGDITSYAYTAPGIVMNTGSGWGNFSTFGLPSIRSSVFVALQSCSGMEFSFSFVAQRSINLLSCAQETSSLRFDPS